MGQEITSSKFSLGDFNAFATALREETSLLAEYFQTGIFTSQGAIGGFEIEAWIVNRHNARPAPINRQLIERFANPLVVTELASFNVEFNNPPQRLKGRALSLMQRDLEDTWGRCRETAGELNTDLVMVGILPSVLESQLSLANMTQSNRYKALNEQVLTMRNDEPLRLDINGRESISTTHYDVMLEAATTSFQIHLQVDRDRAAEFYNIAKIISGPMVAATANSPLLFGKELWEETRIPLFEQAVNVGDMAHSRVTFGNSYARQSLLECFEHNLDDYPVLVPSSLSNDRNRLEHLRFHNGTIWRWNRPLIGFDDNNTPHLRIEHRVVAAGPSIVDSIANAAFFYGLMYSMVDRALELQETISFTRARDAFYSCARDGLQASVFWPDSGEINVRTLLLDRLLPAANEGLVSLEIDRQDIDFYLTIIKRRIENQLTGAAWQRAWVNRHGRNMEGLTLAYLERQNSGVPVCDWGL